MKKTLLIMVMALAVLLTQCRKPEVKFPSPVAPEGTTVSMTVTAGPGSKTDITTAGGITWSVGDKLYVGYDSKYVGYLTLVSGSGTPTGTFSGDVTLPNGTTGENEFGFFYLGSDNSVAPTYGAESVDVSFATQEIYANGTNLSDDAKKFHVGYGSANGTVTDGVVTGINVTLVSKVALARFSFKKNSTDYTDELTLSGDKIYSSMTVGFNGSFDHGATAGNITLTAGHGERYVMLVPTGDATEQTLTFAGSSDEGEGKVPGLESNKFYGKTEPIAVTLTAPAPTHETVNFGTPNLNWSKYNLGVDPSDLDAAVDWYGDYYQWGGVTDVTSTTINVGWDGCPHTSGTYSSSNKAVFTKYVPQDKAATYGYGGFYDDKTVLDAVDDAAAVAWGSDWRMPMTAEWQDLYNYNTFEWLDEGGTSNYVTSFTAVAAGYLVVKGKESSLDAKVYMFLPAAGSRSGSSLYNAGSRGYYWSSSLDSSFPSGAYYVGFFSGGVVPQGGSLRYSGYAVRPVRPAL